MILACLGAATAATSLAAKGPDPERTLTGVGMGACVLPGGHGVATDAEMPWIVSNLTPSVTTGFGRSGVPADLVVRPVRWTENANQGVILPPGNSLRDMNGLSLYFSSATGGFGFRMGYDRRLSPVLAADCGKRIYDVRTASGFAEARRTSASRGAACNPHIDACRLAAAIRGEETNRAPRRFRRRTLSSIRPSRRIRGLRHRRSGLRYGVGGWI